MGNSLQEQLLALGLTRDRTTGARGKGRPDPAGKKHDQPRRSSPPGNDRPGSDRPGDETDLSLKQAYLLREKQEKEQAEQARQRKSLEDRRRRQLNESIRAIVEPNRLNDAAAEFSRHFMYKGRIRKVNVTVEQLKALNEGCLGLVYLAGGYHILKPEYVEQVRLLSAAHVPELVSEETEEEYPVPDDLIW